MSRFRVHKIVRRRLKGDIWDETSSFAVTRGENQERDFQERMADEYGYQDYSLQINAKKVLDIPLREEDELKKAICSKKFSS